MEIKYQAWDGEKMYDVLTLSLDKDNGYSAYVITGEFEGKDTGTYLGEQWAKPLKALRVFTGLKDMHGKECYQGDICADPCIGIKWEVTWHEERACWYLCPLNDDYQPWGAIGMEHLSDFEIIGNIYENTELQEDKQ